MVNAMGTNRRWAMPLRNTTGKNTAMVVAVEARTGRPTSSVASRTARRTVVPGTARWRVMFSRTTMASSTRRPMARVSPPRVKTLRVCPVKYRRRRAADTERGIPTPMMTRLHTLRRNTRTTRKVRRAPRTASRAREAMAARMYWDWSKAMRSVTPWGIPARRGRARRSSSTTWMVLASGWRATQRSTPGWPFTRTISVSSAAASRTVATSPTWIGTPWCVATTTCWIPDALEERGDVELVVDAGVSQAARGEQCVVAGDGVDDPLEAEAGGGQPVGVHAHRELPDEPPVDEGLGHAGEALQLGLDGVVGQVVELPGPELAAGDHHLGHGDVGDVKLQDEGLRDARGEVLHDPLDVLDDLDLRDVEVRSPVEPDLDRAGAAAGRGEDLLDPGDAGHRLLQGIGHGALHGLRARPAVGGGDQDHRDRDVGEEVAGETLERDLAQDDHRDAGHQHQDGVPDRAAGEEHGG